MLKRISRLAPLMIVTSALAITGAHGQQNPSVVHVRHVVQGFPGAPDGRALFEVAATDAAVAVQHAHLARQNPGDLAAMKLHAGHVIHALDPGQMEGPGSGFGAQQAAAAVITHLGMAARPDNAAPSLKTHTEHVTAAVESAGTRSVKAVSLARRILASEDVAAAASLAAELDQMTGWIVTGTDLDGDGVIGWAGGEGGLDQASQHLDLLKASGEY